MKAAVLSAIPAERLDLREVTQPAPREDELLVRVEMCGICGTDLHILAGESYTPQLPFVLGHEPVGIVEAAGEAVDDSWLGRRVTLTLFEGDGSCPECLAGRERLCPNMRSVRGISRAWGGFAEYMTVPVAQAVAVPSGLASSEAAALVDSGATAMNAAEVVIASGVSSALVAGGGPAGFLVAGILRGRGVKPIVVEPHAERRQALAEAGFVNQPDLAADGKLCEAFVDCAGVDGVVNRGFELLAPRGLMVVVGYCRLRDLDFAPVARKELAIRGVRSGSRDHLVEVLGLVAGDELQLPPIAVWPISHINDALAAVRSGEVSGKAVVRIQPDRKEPTCRN